MMTLRLRIDELLKERGRSQSWLARETGIHPTGIDEMCRNIRTTINKEYVARIMKVLGITDIRDLIVYEEYTEAFNDDLLTEDRMDEISRQLNKDKITYVHDIEMEEDRMRAAGIDPDAFYADIAEHLSRDEDVIIATPTKFVTQVKESDVSIKWFLADMPNFLRYAKSWIAWHVEDDVLYESDVLAVALDMKQRLGEAY